MKFLVATAFLIFVVTEAHHTAEHTLRGPRFSVGKVQVYDVELNVTAGVQGLSSQVSKVAFKGELQVYAKSEKEHVLKITKVYTSGSIKAAESKYASVHMQKNRELESRLSIPITFTLENGEITSYTLSPRETVQSKKIKKAILRSLEMHVPQSALQQIESSKPSLRIPVVYNITKKAGWDQHTSHYMITVSPDAEFPYSNMVYNLSRTENFEGERHHNCKFHHNFRQQSCENTCKEWTDDEQGSKCSSEYQSSPVKAYVQHNHHLVLEDGVMTPEIIDTVEVHNAKMYDQDMKVLFRQKIRKISYSSNTIEEPAEQPVFTDLQDQEIEINEDEISNKCEDRNQGSPVEAARKLLREIAATIVEGNLENKESTVVGEKVILLKRALSELNVSDLKALSSEITPKSSLMTAPEDEKVRRQMWMDILPLIGTDESVSFIVSYIKDNIDKELMIWEAKEILEALPDNIHLPTERLLEELRTLLSVLPEIKRNHLFHSAVYSCLARVIQSMCSETEQSSDWNEPESPDSQRSQRPMRQRYSRRNLQQTTTTSRSHSHPECPTQLVKAILQDMTHSLAATKKQDEIIVYLDTLCQTGCPDVLPVVSEYVYGTAENIQDSSPSYIEFVKSAAIYSLHNIVNKFPRDVLNIVMPVFFNETESPKIRTAAFGILVRCNPPLEVLQHVASHSWSERSNEVGSFVTSTMDTLGNVTLPCMQLTARRIKQVMPLLKRFDIGMQHAKNLIWTYFDDVRMFGLKNHLSYTPSNASMFPSAIYQALSYSTGSLVDTVAESALNLQGQDSSEEDIYWKVIGYMFGTVETIPTSQERDIFGEATVAERTPDTLRLTLYKRIFYRRSFYYLDENNRKTQKETLKEYLDAYLKTSSSGHSGHLVKTLLPSSFHTVTIAKSLPYPVEFQMEHPMVLAVKIESKEKISSLSDLSDAQLHIRPSVYATKLLTHQVKNVGDCKEVGAYHEQKLAISIPLELKLNIESLLNATVQYKLPELPKRVLYYFSESGTYAGRKELEVLPSSLNRKPIRTLPAPRKNSTTSKITGLPPVQVQCHSEDIGLLAEDLSSDPVDFIVKKMLNAGWRYKSANISLEESEHWTKDTEATFTMQYSRIHTAKGKMDRQQHSPRWSERSRNTVGSSEWMAASQDEENWSKESAPQEWPWSRSGKIDDAIWTDELQPTDISRNRNPTTFIDQGKHIHSMVSSSLPHITHSLNVSLETRPVRSFASFKWEYNHTYSKSLQSLHMEACKKAPHERTTKQISVDHVIGFAGKPDEFQYDTLNERQKAVFVTGLRTHNAGCSCPWKDVDVVAKGAFEYEPLDSILKDELEEGVDRKSFESEDHDQCLEDIKNGHSQSSSCMKAMKERSILNKLTASILWSNLPENLKSWTRRLDTFIKHNYYRHMSVDYEQNTENKIHVSLSHIERLTERPLFDVTIRKPEETITLRRMEAVSEALSSVYDMLDLDIMLVTNNTYPPTCVIMEKSVRTYDLKYYPISLEGCSYILSSHCTKTKNFAIISKILSPDGMKELHIHIGPHTLIMSPMSGSHYTIKYDNQDYTVSEPLAFDEEDTGDIYVFSEKYASEHRHLEVVAPKVGVRVLYDGKNVKIQVDPGYKGQTCGLCSEFDGETIREFRGVDRCLYSHPDDFVNSAITSGGTCRKQASHPYICEDRSMFPVRENSPKYATLLIRRNIIKVKGNDLCFSVSPVPVCDADSQPTETERRQMGFHCLPKQDITAKRMVSEAKRRSLGEVENKSVDYEETVEVAKTC